MPLRVRRHNQIVHAIAEWIWDSWQRDVPMYDEQGRPQYVTARLVCGKNAKLNESSPNRIVDEPLTCLVCLVEERRFVT